MPAKQRIYKVDVTQLADDIALSQVTGEKDIEKAIKDFCSLYSIPLDTDLIKEKATVYKKVAQSINNAK